MTPPAENRFGRAGGPSMAQIKEYSTLNTTSFLDPLDGAVLLADASSLSGGSADSYYLLWGVTATTDSTNPFFGLLFDSNVTHVGSTADSSTYLGFGANSQGPFFWNTEQPVKINPGSGLKYDDVASTSKYLITIVYSIVHAGV